MRFNFILFVVLLFLYPSMAIPESSKAVEVVELNHPVRDIKDKMQGSDGVDVVKLTASSDGTQLKTTALRMSGKKAPGYLNGHTVFNYDSKKIAWDPQTGVEVKGPIQTNQLEASIPYQTLRINPGSTIRISAYEADAQFKAGCFDDVIMKLK